jgi:hypothetical protein
MSVHENEPSVAQAIWNGEYWGPNGALARHEAVYEASPKDVEDRIPWMSTLYSALGSVRSVDASPAVSLGRTAWCVSRLFPQIAYFTEMAGDESAIYELRSEQCDVLSAVMLKWSAIPILGTRAHLDAALKYATSAYLRKDAQDKAGHTHALVALTLARIWLRKRQPDAARPFLDEAKQDVAAIADANQRARVYRGYAEIIAGMTGYSRLGIGMALDALDLADAVPGIARDVRAKNDALRSFLAKRC